MFVVDDAHVRHCHYAKHVKLFFSFSRILSEHVDVDVVVEMVVVENGNFFDDDDDDLLEQYLLDFESCYYP